jgi:hypothetical protein
MAQSIANLLLAHLKMKGAYIFWNVVMEIFSGKRQPKQKMEDYLVLSLKIPKQLVTYLMLVSK